MTTLTEKPVRLEVADRVAVLTIDYPPVNALAKVVADGLEECIASAGATADVNCLIVTGAGSRAFGAGGDIKAFVKYMENGTGADLAARMHQVFAKLEAFELPTIAAIEGLCVGGGLELALCCDLRYAGATAQFGLPEIKLGLLPGGGGTQRLPRLIGRDKALQLICSGEFMDAQTAVGIGLCTRLVDAGQALRAAREFGGLLALQSGSALRLVKRAFAEGLERPLAEGLALEVELFGAAMTTTDAREGVAAFFEKREASWRHA